MSEGRPSDTIVGRVERAERRDALWATAGCAADANTRVHSPRQTGRGSQSVSRLSRYFRLSRRLLRDHGCPEAWRGRWGVRSPRLRVLHDE